MYVSREHATPRHGPSNQGRSRSPPAATSSTPPNWCSRRTACRGTSLHEIAQGGRPDARRDLLAFRGQGRPLQRDDGARRPCRSRRRSVASCAARTRRSGRDDPRTTSSKRCARRSSRSAGAPRVRDRDPQGRVRRRAGGGAGAPPRGARRMRSPTSSAAQARRCGAGLLSRRMPARMVALGLQAVIEGLDREDTGCSTRSAFEPRDQRSCEQILDSYLASLAPATLDQDRARSSDQVEGAARRACPTRRRPPVAAQAPAARDGAAGARAAIGAQRSRGADRPRGVDHVRPRPWRSTTTETPRAGRSASAFWYECGRLPGKASTSPVAELVALAGDHQVDAAVEAGEELARARQVRRAAHRRAGLEVHHLHHLVGHRLGHQRRGSSRRGPCVRVRDLGGAASAAPSRAATRAARRSARRARAATLTSTDERRIAVARFEVGDGRARHRRRLGQRVLRQRARVAQADEVARQVRGRRSSPASAGRLVGGGRSRRESCARRRPRSDLLPIGWTTRWPCAAARSYRRAHRHRSRRLTMTPLDLTRTPLRVAITGGTSGLGLALVERAARARRAGRLRRPRRGARRRRRARRLPGSHGIVGDVARKDDTHAHRAADRRARSAASTCSSTTRRASARCRCALLADTDARTSRPRSRPTCSGRSA